MTKLAPKSRLSTLKKLLTLAIIAGLTAALIKNTQDKNRLQTQINNLQQTQSQPNGTIQAKPPQVNKTTDGLEIVISQQTLESQLNKDLGSQPASQNPITHFTLALTENQAQITTHFHQGQTVTSQVVVGQNRKSLQISDTKAQGAGIFNQPLATLSQKLLQGFVDAWTQAQSNNLKQIRIEQNQLVLSY